MDKHVLLLQGLLAAAMQVGCLLLSAAVHTIVQTAPRLKAAAVNGAAVPCTDPLRLP
jgi:hypothetical protein